MEKYHSTRLAKDARSCRWDRGKFSEEEEKWGKVFEKILNIKLDGDFKNSGNIINNAMGSEDWEETFFF